MSIWAFACSSHNCLDPLRSPREPLPATHSAEAQQESSHFDFGELRTRSCHVLLIRRIGDRMSLTPSFIPSLSDVERYKRLRRLARDLNHRIVKTVPREAMHEVGETIGILHRGVLVFDTEDETSILMDCCLYDWMRNVRTWSRSMPKTSLRPREPRNTTS